MPLAAPSFSVRAIVRLLRALGDETRLRIVALLTHGELCVCHVEKALDLTQPTASRHLAVLRAGEVVQARREGGWVYYRIAPQADADCQALLRSLTRSFGKEEALRRDVEELLRGKKGEACGSPRAAKSTRPAGKKQGGRRKEPQREDPGVTTARARLGARNAPAPGGAQKATRKGKNASCSGCG